MKELLKRIIPVGITLFPIGVFFGLLAAQANWSVIEVFLMSIIGFTGSGQFAFLGFANQGLQDISLFTVFLVILSMNLRYIPMSLSATQPLKTSILNKFFLAHWLADESYASEKPRVRFIAGPDATLTRQEIRDTVRLAVSIPLAKEVLHLPIRAAVIWPFFRQDRSCVKWSAPCPLDRNRTVTRSMLHENSMKGTQGNRQRA